MLLIQILIAIVLFLLPSLMRNWRWLLGYGVVAGIVFAAALYKSNDLEMMESLILALAAAYSLVISFFGIVTRGATLYMQSKGYSLMRQAGFTIISGAIALPASYKVISSILEF